MEQRQELSLALIAAGAAVDLVDQDHRTALIEATAAGGQDDVVMALIHRGANVNAQDKSGRSALIVVTNSYVSIAYEIKYHTVYIGVLRRVQRGWRTFQKG